MWELICSWPQSLWTKYTIAFYTITTSWGPLLCHSSASITSCFSMIMHSVMSQSVHNSWKLKMSQFVHGLHTHQTCHPLSLLRVLWIDVYDSMFQFPTISCSFAQPLKRSGTTFHRPQSTAWSTLCEVDVLFCTRHGGYTRYWLAFRSKPLPFFKGTLSVTNICISLFPVMRNP